MATYDSFGGSNVPSLPTPPRVVITGLGAITPLGHTVPTTWAALLAGQSGIAPITRFDTSELRTKFAGEVKNFLPENYMDRKEARRLDPFIQYALVASAEAIRDADLALAQEDPTRIGVVIGSAIGLHPPDRGAAAREDRRVVIR